MIIFNHTKVSTTALKTVLYRAAKAVGSVRTGKVVVIISQSVRGTHGRVDQAGYRFYYRWAVAGRKRTRGVLTPLDRKPIHSDGGFLFIWLAKGWEALSAAESFYSVAAHEWRHVRDFQKRLSFGQYNRNWKNRPHERRAINSCKRALRIKDSRTDIQDAIIALGIAIEESRRKA